MRQAVLCAVAVLGLRISVLGETIVVDLNGGGDYTEIQPAIDSAADGDTVLVKAGEYVIREPIDFNRLHDPADPASPPLKNLVLRSEAGSEETTIRRTSGRYGAVVLFDGECERSILEGFTLSGEQVPGVAFRGDSSPAVRGCRISGNGEGVWCDSNSPTGSPTFTHCTIVENARAGVVCILGSPSFTNCTIAGNVGAGVRCWGGSPIFTSCIIWGNVGDAILVENEAAPRITYSCVESQQLWPGDGNIQADPLYCGWSAVAEMFVDASAPEDGDGTPRRPFRDLAAAFGSFRLALAPDSPCLGAGSGGGDMGAHHGVCDGPPRPRVVVRLARGRYSLAGAVLAHGVSMAGAGQQDTVIEGTVYGLRTGSSLSDLTVTGGQDGGIRVAPGEAPEIRSCTITRNSSWEGGGVTCGENASPSFTNCTISRNRATEGFWGNEGGGGGGVACRGGSSPSFTSCTVSDNVGVNHGYFSSVPGGGVFYWAGASPSFTDCTISGNAAGHGGGVCCEAASGTFTNCTIAGNVAFSNGGGVLCWSNAVPSFTRCTIARNEAQEGGGVVCSDSAAPSFTSCILWDNAGDALLWGEVTPETTYSCVETADVWPGEGNINADPQFCGWPSGAELFLDARAAEQGDGTRDRPFRDLTAALGAFRLALLRSSPCLGRGLAGGDMGAAHGVCDGPAVSDSVLHLAAGRYPTGGVVLARGASIAGAGQEETVVEGTVCGIRTGAFLSDVTVTAGQAGGVRVTRGEAPRIRDCSILGNLGIWAWQGGGVSCAEGAAPVIEKCTIAGNWAHDRGGGVFCADDAFPELTNCMVAGNAAWSRESPFGGGSGGGVFCAMFSSPRFTNCTVAGNYAPAVAYGFVRGVGGVASESALATFTNCIIWGNDEIDVTERGSYVHCNTGGEGPRAGEGDISVEPLFVDPGAWEECDPESRDDCTPYLWDDDEPLAWRHWVFDYHLQAGSPCIDSGTTDGASTFDIEDNGRPCGAGVDMGAHESGRCATPIAFHRGDTNADGSRNITDAVFTMLYLFQGGTEPPCLKAADADNKGDVNVTDAVFLLSFLFQGGELPPAPFPDCGWDLDIDELTCVFYSPCE